MVAAAAGVADVKGGGEEEEADGEGYEEEFWGGHVGMDWWWWWWWWWVDVGRKEGGMSERCEGERRKRRDLDLCLQDQPGVEKLVGM